MKAIEIIGRLREKYSNKYTRTPNKDKEHYISWLQDEYAELVMNQANVDNTESKALHIDSVVCSALSDEVATKMLVHCPYEKSGWCTTELGCRFKLENCDAKGNGCELAL